MKAYLDQKNGYILRLACADDAEAYYEQNYNRWTRKLPA